MIEKTFEFEANQNAQIFVRKWMPETTDIKGVLQIAHGMQEHSKRYTEFGEYMTNKGYVVYINDHRGHGQTAKTIDKLGFFAEKNGWNLIVEDQFILSKKIKEEYPDVPLFLLGHSMGSFIARIYATLYKNEIDGLIISGTNKKPATLLQFGKLMSNAQGLFKGKKAKSFLLTGMSFKGNNDRFKPTKTAFDWLSKDHERNLNYKNDKFCGTIFSNRFFYDMFSMLLYLNSKKSYQETPTDLPLLIFSGSMDPVGDYGKEVKLVYNNYKNIGVKDIKLKLYDEGRHEMLNETNRTEVFEDIFKWLEEHNQKK